MVWLDDIVKAYVIPISPPKFANKLVKLQILANPIRYHWYSRYFELLFIVIESVPLELMSFQGLLLFYDIVSTVKPGFTAKPRLPRPSLFPLLGLNMHNKS